MSNGNTPSQGQIIVMSADEKAFARDLEVLVQQHLQRGKLSMIQVGGILQHAATMTDLNVRGHLVGPQGPHIAVAPAGLDRQIRPPTGE